MLYVLNDVCDAPKHYEKAGFTDCTPDVVEGIIGECAKFCEEQLAPLYQSGDAEGCVLKGDQVYTPKGFKEAYAEWIAGGWQGLSVPQEYGGQGLPLSLGLIKTEMVGTANWSWAMYPGLSMGCMNTLLLHGSAAQKEQYLTKLSEGIWTGTMCLTEPQCGTDLSQVKTKAVPNADGTYSISGEKIFISAGDHEMAENIVHIVLARIEGAPEGIKGISLFLIPKYIVKEDGSLETKKNVVCTRLENKMGIKGSATCVMTFDTSKGWLIGKENSGLKQMFTFMNTARLGTALQGLCHSELAIQGALPYTKERGSMRSLTGTKEPSKPADPLIVHPDVRRMLLFIKAITEGSRAMVYHTGLISDGMLTAKTPEEEKKVEEQMGLLTPIAKGWITEMGCEAASQGMQCFGGHGYIREWGMEQNVRDARISTLYEGTTGIQALDLMGRKVALQKGVPVLRFVKEILEECWECRTVPEARLHAINLARYCVKWVSSTYLILARAAQNKEVVGAAAYDYLMFSGYVSTAYFWLKMMRISAGKLAESGEGGAKDPFHVAKIQTGEFYFARVLPRAQSHGAMMIKSPATLMKMHQDNFSTEG